MLTNLHHQALRPTSERNLFSWFPNTQTVTHRGSSEPDSREERSAVSKREEFFDFLSRSLARPVQEPTHNADIDWMIDGRIQGNSREYKRLPRT